MNTEDKSATAAAGPALSEGLGPDAPMRAAFETWASQDGRWNNAIERSGNGYKLLSTHAAWTTWRDCWTHARAAERERIARHFESLDKGVGGFYDPHEPAEIIRALGPNVLVSGAQRPHGAGK